MELEIIDVLDCHLHVDGETITEVRLMSDGSVQGCQRKLVPGEEWCEARQRPVYVQPINWEISEGEYLDDLTFQG